MWPMSITVPICSSNVHDLPLDYYFVYYSAWDLSLHYNVVRSIFREYSNLLHCQVYVMLVYTIVSLSLCFIALLRYTLL